jgi:hypothetical protein
MLPLAAEHRPTVKEAVMLLAAANLPLAAEHRLTIMAAKFPLAAAKSPLAAASTSSLHVIDEELVKIEACA